MTTWRIRMCAGDFGDFSSIAWERRQVGVWYGAWSAEQFSEAMATDDPAGYLNQLEGQQALHWNVSTKSIDATRRFVNVADDDLIMACFNDRIYFGQVVGPLQSEPDHPLNLANGELFKFRGIVPVKSFRLADLPEAFRLIPQSGRSNVYCLRSLAQLVGLLEQCDDEVGVCNLIANMDLGTWLDILGPKGWESIALAFLVIEEGFVPTGLNIGHTLATVDIAGRGLLTQCQIVAQCKKDAGPIPVPAEFLAVSQNLPEGARRFFFAFGGCADAPDPIIVKNRDDILHWLQYDERGMQYRTVLVGGQD